MKLYYLKIKWLKIDFKEAVMEFNFTEKWMVEFVKAQDEFVITQCIKHLQKEEKIQKWQ